jgi:hypothetical protein
MSKIKNCCCHLSARLCSFFIEPRCSYCRRFVRSKKKRKQTMSMEREVFVVRGVEKIMYVHALLYLFDIYKKKLYLFDTKSNV